MSTGPELRHRHSRPSHLRVHSLRVTSCRNTAFTSRPKADHISARLIVRRVRRLNPKSVPQGQSELFSAYRHHGVFTDSPLIMLEAETTHRGHAIVEQIIADLKSGALAHLTSGQFSSNGAWLVMAAIAFNLTRAAGTIASVFHAKATTAADRRTGPTRHLRQTTGPAPTQRMALAGQLGRALQRGRPATNPRNDLTTQPQQAQPQNSGRTGQTGGLSMPARLHRLRTLLYHPQILPRWIEAEAQLIPRRLQRGLPQMVSDCRLWTHADQLAHKYDLADRGRRSRAWQPPVTTNITSISTKSPNGGSNWFITCVNQPEDFSAIPDTARSATWTPCCKSTPCSSVASNLGSISSRLWNHSINESSHASSECPAENTTRHLPTGPAGR